MPLRQLYINTTRSDTIQSDWKSYWCTVRPSVLVVSRASCHSTRLTVHYYFYLLSRTSDIGLRWHQWKAVVDVPCNLQRVVGRLSVINDWHSQPTTPTYTTTRCNIITTRCRLHGTSTTAFHTSIFHRYHHHDVNVKQACMLFSNFNRPTCHKSRIIVQIYNTVASAGRSQRHDADSAR